MQLTKEVVYGSIVAMFFLILVVYLYSAFTTLPDDSTVPERTYLDQVK